MEPHTKTWARKSMGGFAIIEDPIIELNRCIDSLKHPETNSLHLKIGHPKRKLVFQPSIFGCYVSFREGIDRLKSMMLSQFGVFFLPVAGHIP